MSSVLYHLSRLRANWWFFVRSLEEADFENHSPKTDIQIFIPKSWLFMVTQNHLVASNEPTHPIMIPLSKIHVTLPFTSSDFLPYRFPPTALFNLGRLGAFSVPQEASSEHLLAPPATWEVLGAGPTSITASNPKVDGFYCKNCQENIHWGWFVRKSKVR